MFKKLIIKNLKLKTSVGQTFIELILAMGLAAIIFPTLLVAFMSTREGRPQQEQRLQAIALLKETEQAVKSVRNSGWSTFATNGTFHPTISGTAWTLSSGTGTVNGFTQSVVVSDVARNGNGDIVTSGGTTDPSTKRVEITISWTQPQPSSITSTTYYTRTENLTYQHTTDTDFGAGTLDDTQVLDTLGGEILLANNNKGKWCSPSFSTAVIDLPDGPPVAVAATSSAVSINIPNEAFVATSPETTNSIKLAYIRVDADTDTPAATLSGKFTLDPAQYSNPSYVPTGIDLDNTFKTNDVKYYQSSSGKKYALLATDLPDKEVIAVLVDDNNPDNNEDTTGEYADPENKIFKYWTYFNTKMYAGVSEPLTSTGFLSPSSNTAVTTNAGDNDGYGSNPTRAYANDGSFAVDTNSGSNTGTSCTGTDKDKHLYYDYDVPSLPTGVTINGIEVRLDARADSTSGNPKICVELSWDGGTTWTTAQSTNNLTTSEATYTLGGPSDNWGHTWSESQLSNSNFRVRVTNVASNTSRDFSLDWVALNVHFYSPNYDEAPYGYGTTSLFVLDDKGYVASGGYLYVFNLSNIDSKSSASELDMIGCRIELDGNDCNPTTSKWRKYGSGGTGWGWANETNATAACFEGGNTEIYGTNDIYGVSVNGSTYIFAANGGGVDAELDVVDATSVPTGATSPTISNNACGRISGGNSAWKRVGSLDFNSQSGTQEASNSVFARSDGNRAYLTSNGGSASKQYYIIDTSTKSNPRFLTGTPSGGGPTSGFYNGASPAPAADAELYPRRALTVQDGARAVLVGKDGVSNGNNAEEYQVLDNANESTPAYCGGLNFDTGFNDLTSVSELDGDNYVYMVANSTENELRIIQGGPDNAIYVADGTYESPTYDAGSSAAFNSFSATVNKPAATTLQLQVATAPPVSGSCTGASFTFVGPNGDPSQYFEPSGSVLNGTIPFGSYVSSAYQNPGRCFRYKAWMGTSDQTQTPTLYDFTANYSP